jgi:hypothetical protein
MQFLNSFPAATKNKFFEFGMQTTVSAIWATQPKADAE